jgi:hypothetical protein
MATVKKLFYIIKRSKEIKLVKTVNADVSTAVTV